jgi:hypothetical protein
MDDKAEEREEDSRAVDVDLRPGELIVVNHGPYRGTWRVTDDPPYYGEESPRGSRLALRVSF